MRSRDYLFHLASVYAFTGLLEPHMPDSGQPMNSATVAQALVAAALLFFWCKAHARERGVKPPSASPQLVAIVTPIGVPYYAFGALGPKAGAALILKSIGLLLLLTFLYGICYEISARVVA